MHTFSGEVVEVSTAVGVSSGYQGQLHVYAKLHVHHRYTHTVVETRAYSGGPDHIQAYTQYLHHIPWAAPHRRVGDGQCLRQPDTENAKQLGPLMVRRVVSCSCTDLGLLKNKSYLSSLWNMLLQTKVKNTVWSLAVKAAGVTQQPLWVMRSTAEKVSKALCKAEH